MPTSSAASSFSPDKNSDLPAASGASTPASDFNARLAQAENQNLRERLARLEASIAHWAADVDEASDENSRLRGQIEALRSDLRAAQESAVEAQRERASLVESVGIRDAHIADLEARILAADMTGVAERRTRGRLVAIRRRVRTRLVAQSHEIEGLRRMLSLGHAARRQVEEELREARTDAVRNAKYLDRIEARLAEFEGGSGLAGRQKECEPNSAAPRSPGGVARKPPNSSL